MKGDSLKAPFLAPSTSGFALNPLHVNNLVLQRTKIVFPSYYCQLLAFWEQGDIQLPSCVLSPGADLLSGPCGVTLIEQNLFKKITLVKERNFLCLTLLIIELKTQH